MALAAAVLAAGGGVAAATGVLPLWPPGGPVITPLAAPITVTGSGTQTIDLGPQPAGANAISLEFTCLTAGSFTFGDASTEQCGSSDPDSQPATGTLPLSPGQQSTSVAAAPGERWRVTVFYASVTLGTWKTNANGQTYGVQNANGTPDLVAAEATNGCMGYVYASQMTRPPPASPAEALAEQAANTKGVFIPVYESDGTTVIGRFEIAEPGAVP
jgi:hypothetical protein